MGTMRGIFIKKTLICIGNTRSKESFVKINKKDFIPIKFRQEQTCSI